MGFVIIEGRSGGYPCIPQLPELDSSCAMRAPFPKGYPVAASGQIPKPSIGTEGTEVALSMLVSGGKVPHSLYWNGARITAVYLNEKEKLRVFVL